MSRHDRLLLTLPLAAILSLFLIAPAAFGFFASFTDYAPTGLHTRLVGLDNYAEVVQSSEFGSTIRNIFLFGIIAIPAELGLGLFAAYLLRESFRGRGLVRVLLLVPWLISPVANGVMWHFMFASQSGLFSFFAAWLGSPSLPSPLGIPSLALPAAILADVWRNTSFVSFLLLPGMIAIPVEQWEFSTLEGASTWDRVRQIILPWLRPLLLTITLLLIGQTLGTFDGILVMTGGGPGSSTMVPGLYSYQQAFTRGNWPVGAASAWLIIAVLIMFGLAYLGLGREGTAEGSSGRFPSGIGFLPRLGFPSFKTWNPGWKKQRQLSTFIRAMLIGLFLAAFLIPLLWTFLASFDIKPQNSVAPPKWQAAVSLDNYQEVGVTEPGFMEELVTSTNLAIVTTALTMATSFLLAFALARSPWRRKQELVQVFLILASLPVMAYAIPLSATTRSLHLYDTFVGATLAETAMLSPLAVYVLFGYLAQLSPDMEQAAYLEGANALRVLWSIVLPAIAAGMAATAIVIFVLSWNQFLVPFVVTTDNVRSIPMAMVDVFKWDRELEWSSVAAALLASLLPLLVLVAAAHRLLERFSLRPS